MLSPGCGPNSTAFRLGSQGDCTDPGGLSPHQEKEGMGHSSQAAARGTGLESVHHNCWEPPPRSLGQTPPRF